MSRRRFTISWTLATRWFGRATGRAASAAITRVEWEGRRIWGATAAMIVNLIAPAGAWWNEKRDSPYFPVKRDSPYFPVPPPASALPAKKRDCPFFGKGAMKLPKAGWRSARA